MGVKLPLVEFTGGEPLAQRGVIGVMRELCDEGYTVLLETSGALDMGAVDSRVVRVMDLKAPSSGEVSRNLWENIGLLRPHDEVKFVLGSEEDYEWMKGVLAEHDLASRCSVLVSWVAPLTGAQASEGLKAVPSGHHPIGLRALAERVVADGLPVRFQVQMHKVIWSPDQRGV
jgi:7-carboxy-7-deazaguanine synthase